jgi:hypothetical protein
VAGEGFLVGWVRALFRNFFVLFRTKKGGSKAQTLHTTHKAHRSPDENLFTEDKYHIIKSSNVVQKITPPPAPPTHTLHSPPAFFALLTTPVQQFANKINN